MTVVCPITTRQSSFPLHLALPEICHTRGMVMTEQIKSLDFAARHADFIERVPEDFAATVKNYINTFWQ
jgi:mRNA interferase MazF